MKELTKAEEREIKMSELSTYLTCALATFNELKKYDNKPDEYYYVEEYPEIKALTFTKAIDDLIDIIEDIPLVDNAVEVDRGKDYVEIIIYFEYKNEDFNIFMSDSKHRTYYIKQDTK